MQYSPMLFIFIVAFYNFGGWRLSNADAPEIAKTISVSPTGRADFTTITDAIAKGVPDGNSDWIQIIVHKGEYKEQVVIPINKPYIVLQGVGSLTTTIAYSSVGIFGNGTLNVFADNFLARDISIKNTYNHALIKPDEEHPRLQAIAVGIHGDKVSFYRCSFIGVQDTLFDNAGRHFFQECYIEGSIDFICGNGQSVYETCNINATAAGYITAQLRSNANEPTGFVFKSCKVYGTTIRRSVYLGRPWGPYSRVVYYQTELSHIIRPKGWDAWNFKGHESNFTYAEVDCTGPGSDTTQRVNWVKNLNRNELQFFLSPSFSDGDAWIQNQPSN